MRANVNPFEPWRPAAGSVPPPVHANRPWRPPAPPRGRAAEPLLVEPADPPAAKDRPKKCRRPAAEAARPPRREHPAAPSPGLRPDQQVLLATVFAMGVMNLIGLGWLGGTHLPRVAATLLAVGAGVFAGVSLARRRGWSVRLGWMAAGLALAGLAAWFVPTTNGVNLWSAYRQVEQLRALPAGDVAAYRGGAADRQAVVAEFPALAQAVADAERAWLRRTVDKAIEKADDLLEADPRQAADDLDRLAGELERLEHYPQVRKELDAARQRVRKVARR